MQKVESSLWSLWYAARDARNSHASFAAHQAIRSASRNLIADSNAWRKLAEYEMLNASEPVASTENLPENLPGSEVSA